jgi:polysaccharide biosynthesis protein PslG
MTLKLIPSVLLVALLGASLPAVVAPSAQAAPAPRITIGSKQLVNQLPFVDPIYVGYKGTQSFIPAAVANKKDKFGCNLRQRMIIDLATKKPKVSKGCKMKGGVWTTALGSKVTKPANLLIGPIMSYKDAWGQGAFAWTPEQRLAWATNTKVSGAKTRAKGVTNNQVTQTLISKQENAAIRSATQNEKLYQSQLGILPEVIRNLIKSICQPYSLQCALYWSMWGSNFGSGYVDKIKEYQEAGARAKCAQLVHLASNVTAWGLSVSPELWALMRNINEGCANSSVGVELSYRLNGINPVKPTWTVPPEAPEPSVTPSGVAQLFSNYPAASSGVPVPGDAFGIHAPVDWGTPGVGTSWVRLWDAGVSWAQMEPTQGNIDFSKLRASIASAESYGARVLYVLGDTPGWANGGRAGNIAPNSNDSALNFIRALKDEFGSRIGAYEVWNEGNLSTYWTGSQKQLAQLTKGMKDVLGGTSLLFAASTGTRATNAFVTNYGDYLDELSALGWPVDGYTVHSYPVASAGPTERVSEIGQFKTMLALRGAPVKPIWDTELNYGLAGLGEGVRRIDDATGAAYIAQSYIQSIQYGIDVTYWYMWTGTRGFFDLLGAQLDPATPISNTVWNNLRGMLNGSRMTRCTENFDVGFACQFAPSGGAPFTLMWTRAGTSQVNVSGIGTQVCDLLGNACTPVTNSTVTIGMLPVRVS